MTEAAVDAGESALYEPIKAFLEAQGYEVKGEVEHCDVVGRRGDEAPVIVELKQRLSLELIVQGVERQRLSHHVYLAFPVPKKRSHTVWTRSTGRLSASAGALGLGCCWCISRRHAVTGSSRASIRGHTSHGPTRGVVHGCCGSFTSAWVTRIRAASIGDR